jgi:hypothetical protein
MGIADDELTPKLIASQFVPKKFRPRQTRLFRATIFLADSDRQPEQESRTARSSSSVNPDMNSPH